MKAPFAILTLAVLAAVACQKVEGSGQIDFTLEEGVVADVVTKGKLTDYTELPEESSFCLTVRKSNSSTLYSGPLDEWNPSKKLAFGNYSAEVSCGSEGEEGPGKPYFTGSATFAVNSASTEVSVPVTLGNSIVKVEQTDNFKNYYPTSSFTVSTPDNTFVWEGEPLFVAYQFSVGGTVTSQAGKSLSLETKTWKGKAATCYTVKYDVDNVGGVTVTISFDDSVQTVEVGDVELNN